MIHTCDILAAQSKQILLFYSDHNGGSDNHSILTDLSGLEVRVTVTGARLIKKKTTSYTTPCYGVVYEVGFFVLNVRLWLQSSPVRLYLEEAHVCEFRRLLPM